MVVRLGVLLDLDEMNGRDRVVWIHEGATRCAAGAGNGIDVAEVGDIEALSHFLEFRG